MADKDLVEYCYNPKTKEIVEGEIPPSDQFIPIIGYFKRSLDPTELQKTIEEIVSKQEHAFTYDQYAEDQGQNCQQQEQQ